ncbi:MAG TPA: carboxypeptidase-like regulatory domain-containing protein [Gemmatimonadales bacterium]|nr:carboxypeptidase-like regulatory domain-containing protein [Gemmatimonadales bacterium]
MAELSSARMTPRASTLVLIVLFGLFALLVAPSASFGQTVQGRVLHLGPDTPVPGALVALVDAAGRDVARAVSSASGGFTLAAAQPGRYHVTVRQIGWRPWESPAFELAAGTAHPLVLRIDAEPYALPTITVEAKRPRCGIRLGDDELVSRLLEVAQTALALAQATADQGTLGFSSEWYLARYTPDFQVTDSSSSGVGRLASWPIQSAPPDTLARWGFVRTDGEGQAWTDVGADRGPVYFGLDARTLFSDWFLASHCFRLEDSALEELRVAFAPERRSDRVDVAGMLVLDRASLELRRIGFEYVNLPRWIPRAVAGGEVRLRRLRSGAWVPYAWRVRAPVPRLEVGRPRPRLHSWVETGGWVRSVRGPAGVVDSALTREVLGVE